MSYYAVLMSGKQPFLLPAGSVSTPSSDSAGMSSKAMARRNLTQNACLGCRKKRTKCDGRSPCAGCIVRRETCEYEDKTYVTKDNLRAEVKILRLETINNRAVLRALLGDQHRSIAQRLRLGETVDGIAQTLTSLEFDGKGKSPDGDEDRTGSGTNLDLGPLNPASPSHASEAELPSPISPTTTTTTSKTAGFSFNLPVSIPNTQLPSPVAPPGFVSLQALPDFVSEIAGLPLLRVDDSSFGYLASFTAAPGSGVPLLPSSSDPSSIGRHGSGSSAAQLGSVSSASSSSPPPSGSSSWTNVAGNSVTVNYLLSLFFGWEFPPFTMVSQELFMRDYFQSRGGHCSPALVNSIASLATRYLEEADEVGESYILGERFFREARKLLVLEARTPNLPSIQAFGLLALRELSCGRECEAQTLCLQAARCLAKLADGDVVPLRNQTRDYIAAYTSTVSGVLSLARVIGLITPGLSPSSVSLPDGPRDRHLPVQLEERVAQLYDDLPRNSDPTTGDKLSRFIFELTDTVYAFLSRAGDFGTRRVTDQLQMVYQRCLTSYQSITELLQGEGGKSSPHTLFVHTYFQFSLLILFHPFVDQYLDIGGDGPRTICGEATQAIVNLMQSYASLYTLRLIPCFAPYCVFAAGLTQILLNIDERKGSEGASGYPDHNQTYPNQQQPTARSPASSGTSPSVADTSSPSTSSLIASPAHSMGSGGGYGAGDGAGIGDTFMTGMNRADHAGRTAFMSTHTTNMATPGSEQADSGLTLAVYLLSQMSLGHPGASQAAWVLRHFTPDQARLRQSSGFISR